MFSSGEWKINTMKILKNLEMLKLNEAHHIPSWGFLSLCLVIVYGVVQIGGGGGGDG